MCMKHSMLMRQIQTIPMGCKPSKTTSESNEISDTIEHDIQTNVEPEIEELQLDNETVMNIITQF